MVNELFLTFKFGYILVAIRILLAIASYQVPEVWKRDDDQELVMTHSHNLSPSRFSSIAPEM